MLILEMHVNHLSKKYQLEQMIIKVCGIKTEENILFLSKSSIDMVGLNFYQPSIRYVPEEFDPEFFDILPSHIKRVGVFVNERHDNILRLSKKFKLDYAQLHGDENSEFCKKLSEWIPIIKVFRIDDGFEFSSINAFAIATYFLFDTQTKNYGGSGKKFDWNKLKDYRGKIPFLLSGGIGPDSQEQLVKINHSQFVGIDINSKFESEPGIKDKSLILPFLESMRIS